MRLLGLLVVVTSVGCASLDEDDDARPPPLDTRPESAFVAIVTPNGKQDWVCSGVVISRRHVLSAAHCFRGGNTPKDGWRFEVAIGEEAHAAGTRRVPIRPHLHPDYESKDADIAVAVADEDLAVVPRHWLTEPLPADVLEGGLDVRYAGFGGGGVRHVDRAQIVGVESGTLKMTSSRNPCHGDSGGPLLAPVRGVEMVLGIGYMTLSDGEGGCYGGAHYMRTDRFASFISAVIGGQL